MGDHLEALKSYSAWVHGDIESLSTPFGLTQAIDALIAEVESLRKNEYICKKCGLRKNDDHPKGGF